MNPEDSKEHQLLMGILSGEYKSDGQAAKAIYDQPQPDAKYVMLRSRLRKKLLNHLFFLDFNRPGIKVSHQHEQEVMNQLHFANMLMKKGTLQLAERMATKAVALAKEAEFTALAVSGLEMLMTIHAELHKPHAHEKTETELNRYRMRLDWENNATLLFQHNQLKLNQGVRSRRQHLTHVKGSIQLLEESWQQIESFNVFDHYYKLKVWYLELVGDYEGIIALTREVETMLSQQRLNRLRFDLRYNRFIEIHAYLRTKQYGVGLYYAEEYLEAFDSTTVNWFAFMENYLLLALHARNYELAQNLFANVSLNPYQDKLNALARERWTLYQAYLYFIRPNPTLLKDFDYQALVASVPHYSKDKAGFNVAILILQFIQHLQQNDIDVLLNRIEALSMYVSRYLKGLFSDRSRTMFRLLRIIVECNLDLKLIQIRSKYLVGRLATMTVPGDAYAEIEIIPYEHLWELCLESLTTIQAKTTKP